MFICLVLRRLVTTALFLLAYLTSGVAEFRQGDVVPMSFRTQRTGGSVEEWETPWVEALRSQMPRFGRPGTVPFNPLLPDAYSPKDKLAIVFAFSHEQFVLPRVATREGDEGVRLTRLVLTFVYAAGDIVRIRSDPEYSVARGDEFEGLHTFGVEYRWDRLPEEDEQAGMSLMFAVSLLVTVFLAVDVCNGGDEEETASGNGGVGDGAGRSTTSARVSNERRRR